MGYDVDLSTPLPTHAHSPRHTHSRDGESAVGTFIYDRIGLGIEVNAARWNRCDSVGG